jgi:hypothetical protein
VKKASGDIMTDRALAFVFTGESNSGGIGLNADAAPAECAERPCLQILNLTSGLFGFESLQVGVNNLRDHAGLEDSYDSCHGFEIALANLVDAGMFTNHTSFFLIKTGQGGSRIDEWEAGARSGYWARFVQRVTAAGKQIPTDRQWVVWLSLGINDAIAGTPIDVWKKHMAGHLIKLKSELPGTIIVMTQFQSMSEGLSLSPINQAIAEIADAEDNVFVVNSNGADLRDTYHWSYAGLKTVGSRMAAATKRALNLLEEES